MDFLFRLGISHPLGFRLLTVLAIIMASTGMFALGINLFRRADIALVCSTFYAYNSYLLRDLFDRGSPQGWAVSLFPWAVWLLIRVSDRFTGLLFALASICCAMIVLLHTTALILFIPISGIFFFYLIFRNGFKQASASILAIGAGILLSAFYLVPYFAEQQYVQLDNLNRAAYTQPIQNPLQIEDFISLPHIFDVGIGNNSMAESGGFFHVVVLFSSVVLIFIFLKQKHITDLILAVGLFSTGVGMIWLQTDAATWVWEKLPILNILQFRWKLLEILPFISAILIGFLLPLIPPRYIPSSSFVIISIYILSEIPSLYPQLQFRYNQFSTEPSLEEIESKELLLNVPGLTAYDEFLPRWREDPINSQETNLKSETLIANLPVGGNIIETKHKSGGGDNNNLHSVSVSCNCLHALLSRLDWIC